MEGEVSNGRRLSETQCTISALWQCVSSVFMYILVTLPLDILSKEDVIVPDFTLGMLGYVAGRLHITLVEVAPNTLFTTLPHALEYMGAPPANIFNAWYWLVECINW
ncbi:hypothetical protein DEU56DRAFT_760758 [Suillus clintonianus]|uniref:uncharacterized protein n=1 Tax=Suillus clintonianus TaxID=1904413 RepID=UPI001B86AF84|nr:uncharacterized protein DEU56DRAFT_760758 [Suillus clintonianus]KAG2121276.1 hypothetical protein DEU56DRAFT_760758 [Suillus clintonianus]